MRNAVALPIVPSASSAPPLREPVTARAMPAGSDTASRDFTYRLAQRRVAILLRHYPRSALTQAAVEAAEAYEQHPSATTAAPLLELPATFFASYVELLREETGWDQATIDLAFDRTAIIEVSRGCPYDCSMCYIDAPKVDGFLPWPHVREIVDTLARRQHAVLKEEALDVLIQNALGGRFGAPQTPLDAVLALARHRRNRFQNFSDHFMLYWRSNPTNWRDPLFQKHFGHIAEHVHHAFQLVETEKLVEAVGQSEAMRVRFDQEFACDARKLRDATTLHAIVSTIPYAPGSLNDQSVRYMLDQGVASSSHLRISIPHPRLLPSRAHNPGLYWANVLYTLRATDPKVVYLFPSTLDELHELTTWIAQAFERSDRPWWIEARLALYEIDQRRRRGEADADILAALQRALKRLSFVGTREGRAKQLNSPFYARRGTVMCVNGLVLGAGEVSFQACTDPAGSDLEEGRIETGINAWTGTELRALVNSHPLVNRSRESVTPNLAAIPQHRRRPVPDWFTADRAQLRDHPLYEVTRAQMHELLDQARPFLRL